MVCEAYASLKILFWRLSWRMGLMSARGRLTERQAWRLSLKRAPRLPVLPGALRLLSQHSMK
jgi:hypothetical protein